MYILLYNRLAIWCGNILPCVHLQAQPQKVRQQLLAEGLELEEVGGNVQVVECAAPKGKGLLELEEALLLQVSSCYSEGSPAYTYT